MYNRETPPIVTVAISTMGERYKTLDLPSETPGVCYVILLQSPPAQIDGGLVARSDVRVETLDGLGLSRSRNAALDATRTQYLLVSDDDVALDVAGILALAEKLRARPEYAFAVGWRKERLPSEGKRAGVHNLTRFNTGRVCAPEFLVDLDAFRTAGVRFDTDFGLGAKHGIGEEYVFLTDALKAGLSGFSAPIVTGSHPEESTGDYWADANLLKARIALLKRVFGGWHVLMRVAFALRHRRKLWEAGQFMGFVTNRLS